jgi:fucose permease
MAFMGAMPLGSLLQGWVASRIGAPATVAMGGLACLAGAAWFLSRMKEMRVALRPIYTRLGIIPATPGGPAARG